MKPIQRILIIIRNIYAFLGVPALITHECWHIIFLYLTFTKFNGIEITKRYVHVKKEFSRNLFTEILISLSPFLSYIILFILSFYSSFYLYCLIYFIIFYWQGMPSTYDILNVYRFNRVKKFRNKNYIY